MTTYAPGYTPQGSTLLNPNHPQYGGGQTSGPPSFQYTTYAPGGQTLPPQFNWSPGLNTAVPSPGQGGQMYGPGNFGQGFQGPAAGAVGQMYGPGQPGQMFNPMQQALGAMGGGGPMQRPGYGGMPGQSGQGWNLSGPAQPDPYFAGRVKPAYTGPTGASQVPRAGGFNPMGAMQGQMPGNLGSLFGAFLPRGGAPMSPPPGVTGDPLGGLLGGVGGGGMNPQVLQAIMAMFSGAGRGRGALNVQQGSGQIAPPNLNIPIYNR